MHPDRKIGFAMGILLIGIVGALFFRNEPLSVDDIPRVRREQELNNHLRERDVAVYVNESGSANKQESTESPLPWTLPELVKDLDNRNSGVPLPVGMQPASDPVADHLSKPEPVIEPNSKSDDDDFPPLFPNEPSIVTDDATKSPDRPEPGSSGPVRSEDSTPAEYDEYVVRYGDTLSQIAEKFLGSQAKYLQIYEANKDRMQAPDRLQVGMSLRIPRQPKGGSLQ